MQVGTVPKIIRMFQVENTRMGHKGERPSPKGLGSTASAPGRSGLLWEVG